MTARRHLVPLAALLGACALPGAAAAQQEAGEPAPSTGGTAFGATTVADSGSLTARTGVFVGHTVRFQGELADAAGKTVAIQRREGEAWVTATTTQADDAGSFLAKWRADHTGHFTLRAVIAGQEPVDGDAHTAASVPTRDLVVYRRTVATWYGPGFWGHKTACGQKLTHSLLGVAHRTLPCGTPVSLMYRGRTITVPVVDRGPYRNGADYDLTYATSKALDFTATGSLGAVRMDQP